MNAEIDWTKSTDANLTGLDESPGDARSHDRRDML
jgi:hypothetical protein